MHHQTQHILLSTLITALMLSACQAGMQSKDAQNNASPDPNTQSNNAPDPDKPDKPQLKPIEPAFALKRNSVRLLPFKVRMRKLSIVTGLPANDPAFDTILAARYELGDFNHAQSIRPDLGWNAAKMSRWVKGLKPVCASTQFKQTYPDLPNQLDAMILAAYGRKATPDDITALSDVAQHESIPPEQRDQLLCIAVLSSMEFLAQ